MTKKLDDALYRKMVSWAGQLTKLAKTFAPNHLRQYIHSTAKRNGEGRYIVQTMVDRSKSNKQKYGSADARAQEYGSGLRARRGPKAKYPIQGHPFLVFKWDVADANPDKFKFYKGKVVLPRVMHPGIQAANQGKGYIGPAMIQLRRRAKQELDPIFKEAILDALRPPRFGRVK